MSKIISVKQTQTDEIVKLSKEILIKDGIFIYPTDTIYGFGCLMSSIVGAQRIKKIKDRFENKPFIHLANNVEMVLKYIHNPSELSLKLMNKFWPGPMTLILPTKFSTIAFRIPQNNFCLEITKSLNEPITSTSINKTDHPPLTNISAIINLYRNDVDLIIDDGNSHNLQPSSIIDVSKSKPVIIRKGTLSNEIEKFINEN